MVSGIGERSFALTRLGVDFPLTQVE